MAAYTVINGTEGTLTNVDGASTNVSPLSYKDGITLTSAQLATLLDGTTFGKPIAAVADLTGNAVAEQLKRVLATAGLFKSS